MNGPVIAPESVEELRGAVARSARQVIGGGTKCGGGAAACGGPTPEAGGLTPPVSTRALRRIVEYAPRDLTITVEAGLSLDALAARLAADRWRVGLDACGYGGRATVGGVLASGDAGPLRRAFGGPRDQVLGAAIVLGDGSLVRSGGRVFKNVAGYALHRLVVGSWGQFGAIASVTLKLRPVAEALRLCVLPAADPGQAEAITTAVLAGPTRPAVLGWVQGVRGCGDLPGGLAVVAGFEDFADAVAWQVDQTRRMFPDARPLDEPASLHLYQWLRSAPERTTLRAALPSGRLADVFAAAPRTDLVAHVGGAMVMARPTHPDETLRLVDLIRRLGGTITGPGSAATTTNATLRDALRRALQQAVPP